MTTKKIARTLVKKAALSNKGVVAKSWKLFEIGEKAFNLVSKAKKVVSNKSKKR